MSPGRNNRVEISYARRVRTLADAGRFLDTVGLCVLFPVKNIPLPSLYYAVSRCSDARWDKHAQLIWKWKDELPNKRRAFYGKYFHGRGTFLSLEVLTALLAMEEVAVELDEADEFYLAGRISHDAAGIWRALAQYGPIATLELRHACEMETQAGNKRFKKAMLELQGLLIVTHSGAEQETDAWASNRFDLVARAFPRQVAEARKISPEAARAFLAGRYRRLYPETPPVQIARLFSWSKTEAETALAAP